MIQAVKTAMRTAFVAAGVDDSLVFEKHETQRRATPTVEILVGRDMWKRDGSLVARVVGPSDSPSVPAGQVLHRRRTHRRDLYLSIEVLAEDVNTAESLLGDALAALPRSIDDGDGNGVMWSSVVPDWIEDESQTRRVNGVLVGILFRGGVYRDVIRPLFTSARPSLGQPL